jgi:hypothetical protein
MKDEMLRPEPIPGRSATCLGGRVALADSGRVRSPGSADKERRAARGKDTPRSVGANREG